MAFDAKLAIFDHSGVLSDDRLPVYEANMLLLNLFGIEKISFEDWLAKTKATAGKFIKSFDKSIDEKIVDNLYAQFYSIIVSRNFNSVKPEMYADVHSTLSTLKNDYKLKIALISNHPSKKLNEELDEYNIKKFFDIVSGDPAPKVQRIIDICDALQILPKNTFFVEDSIYGLRAGKEAGVYCFGITTGYHSREMLKAENPFKVIDSLSELLDYVAF